MYGIHSMETDDGGKKKGRSSTQSPQEAGGLRASCARRRTAPLLRLIGNVLSVVEADPSSQLRSSGANVQ